MVTSQQYNAVVAQNKSLQGELRLYKLLVHKLGLEIENLTNCGICGFGAGQEENCHSMGCAKRHITYFKTKALQELEAENGLY